MPAAADTAAAAASVAAYQHATTQLRDKVAGFVAATWAALGAWRDEQMLEFVPQVLPVIQGGQAQMSALTTAFLAEQRRAALGGAFTPVAVRPGDVTGAAARNGVPLEEVYSRPFHTVWRDLSNGTSLDKAVEHGLQQAQTSAVTDLQRTKTLASQQVLKDAKNVVGYRRLLEGPRNCGLCIVASTQRYRQGELLPIHPGCDCGVDTIYGDEDPGLLLDEQLLQDAHAAIQERFGVSDSGARTPDYRKLILVREHGELGPVLTVAGHKFTAREAKRSGLDLTGVTHL